MRKTIRYSMCFRRKLYLSLFFLMLCVQASAQAFYYEANGVNWWCTPNGSNATILGTDAFWPDMFEGELNIPSEVYNGSNRYTVTAIGQSAFENYVYATSLTIPNTVKTIGSYAFAQCENLTGELKIPEGVTTIEKNTFQLCGRITSLVLPTTLETIGTEAFYDCTGISGELKIPAGVKTIGAGAFRNCQNLTGDLKIPAGVTTIEKVAFFDCHKLETVTFESGSAYAYTSGDTFWGGCNSLKYIDMRGLASPLRTTISRSNDAAYLFSSLQPYTMVYLPAGSSEAMAGEVNFVIGNTCDKFIVIDDHISYKDGRVGCDYPILQAFTAKEASYVNRSFSGTTCKTICLPYPAKLPTGMQAYELKEKISDIQWYRFVSINGTTLEANKPYILRITDGMTYYFGTENNVSVPATPSSIEVSATNDGNSFFGGTTVNIDNTKAAGMGIYNLSNNKWYPITLGNTNGYLHSFRAYLKYTGAAPAKSFAIMTDDDTTTGINEMIQDVEQGNGEIYTIDGCRMGNDINALKSGEIYIRNGKKFYKF